MKIEFPKLTQEIDLAEYHPGIQMTMTVWVNPPIKTLQEFAEISDKVRNTEGKEGFDDYLAKFSELLSQGEKEKCFTVDELRELIEGTAETDPSFWAWIHNKIMDTILDHRNGIKKN